MTDKQKAKQDFIQELDILRQRVTDLMQLEEAMGITDFGIKQ
jgi:hypothetical protein